MNHYCSEHPPNQGNKVSGRRWVAVGVVVERGVWVLAGWEGIWHPCTCWHQQEVLPYYSCMPFLTPPEHTSLPATPLPPARLPACLQFLVALMKAPGSVVTDLQNKTTHTIDPANLAHRIIQIRSDMAATMVSFPK